jgi:hypothetical protein
VQPSASLRNQYSIGYTPSGGTPDGEYHKIKLTTKDLIVDTRDGYYARQGWLRNAPEIFPSGQRSASSPLTAYLAIFLCPIFAVLAAAAPARAQASGQSSPPASIANSDMAHMSGHMYMTSLQPLQPGDRQKAAAVVEAAKTAMAPYQDYRKALADGYEIFLPNVPQAQYHFTKREYGLEARSRFDPLKPTSLLYKKTADGGYRLVGVMYTDRVNASEDEINGRIPLSIARWHQHINFCKAPRGQENAYFGPNAKFGLIWSDPVNLPICVFGRRCFCVFSRTKPAAVGAVLSDDWSVWYSRVGTA